MVKKGIQDGSLFQKLTKSDRVRWVVLKGSGEMTYYKDDKETHPQNRFFLEPGSVWVDRSADPDPTTPRRSGYGPRPPAPRCLGLPAFPTSLYFEGSMPRGN